MVLSDYSISINGMLEQKNMRPFGEYFKQEILKRPGPFFQCVMLKKELITSINNPFDTNSIPSEDWNFFIELSKLKLTITHINEPLFTWNIHNENQSLNLDKEAKALEYIITKHNNYIQSEHNQIKLAEHYRRIARVYEKNKNWALPTRLSLCTYPTSVKNLLSLEQSLLSPKKK